MPTSPYDRYAFLGALTKPPNFWSQMQAIGVTGTKGKTSTTAFVAACLSSFGLPVPRETTVGNFIDDELIDTEDSPTATMRVMAMGYERGARYAAIEFASLALMKGWATKLPCKVAILTNVSRDHLDYHKTLENYLACKAQLFVNLLPGGCAVLNMDDPAYELIREVVPAHAGVLTFSREQKEADFHIYSAVERWSGTFIKANDRSGYVGFELPAIGDVYAENAAAAYLAATFLGVTKEAAVGALMQVQPPPGRFQVVSGTGEPHVVVDYAHTPDALWRLVQTGNRLKGKGKLIIVFGAGGDRDQGKRPIMGQAVCDADRVIITSDNPRNEDPEAIARAIAEGCPNAVIELDRRAAMRTAISEAGPDDVVLIAGKGHESTQEIKGVFLPFDDVVEAREALKLRSVM